MKLTSNHETIAENKVVILYILNKVAKPLTDDALYKLILASQDMNYFYFRQFLLDLKEINYITTYTLEEDIVYEITETGKDALSLVEDIIPGIIKLKMDDNLKSELDEIEEGNSITSEYIPISQTEYIVRCKIVENNQTLFEVKTYTGSREKAKQISDNWNQNAITLYPKILGMLSDGS